MHHSRKCGFQPATAAICCTRPVRLWPRCKPLAHCMNVVNGSEVEMDKATVSRSNVLVLGVHQCSTPNPYTNAKRAGGKFCHSQVTIRSPSVLDQVPSGLVKPVKGLRGRLAERHPTRSRRIPVFRVDHCRCWCGGKPWRCTLSLHARYWQVHRQVCVFSI